MKINAARAIVTIVCLVLTGIVAAQTYATLPFSDDFTSLGASWSTSISNAAGRIESRAASGNWPYFSPSVQGTAYNSAISAPTGNGLAVYNTSDLGSDNKLNAMMYMNLAAKVGVNLTFHIIDWGTGYSGCMDSLKIYLSVNGGSTYGSSFILVNINQAPYSDGFWNSVTADISGLANTNSMTLSSTSVIKMTFNLRGSGNVTGPKNGHQFVYIDNLTVATAVSLPVEMLSFEGLQEKSGNLLTWATASEINNDYFELQRSYDGVSFETIDQQNGKGMQYGGAEYSYLDRTAKGGVSYYRLKQVDFDGTTTYSQMLVLREKQNISITSFGGGQLSINGSNLQSAQCFDVNGKLIAVLVLNSAASSQSIFIDPSLLADGVYFVRLISGSDAITQKFVL